MKYNLDIPNHFECVFDYGTLFTSLVVGNVILYMYTCMYHRPNKLK